MFSLFWLCLVLLLGHVRAASALALPPPNLPFGDINVLVLTDTHSWVGGHSPNEPLLNADYGDVLSFYQRLSQYCASHVQTCGDLFFVVNGDWIDGTGLSLNGETFGLTQILEKMPWDAVNIGNHELYRADVIDFIREPGGFVEWWGDRYLSSNIVMTNTQKPIGHHYRVLRGPNSVVLTFGFLYNMKNNADVVTVLEVETVVQQTWFIDALHSEEFDAILVLAHMGARDPLTQVILNKIRSELGDNMPVQFVTGHTHVRDYTVVDEYSTSFEAGRFLDTLGFVSFPNRATVRASESQQQQQQAAAAAINTTSTTSSAANGTAVPVTADLFKHIHLDANREVFKNTLHVETLATSDGSSLSNFIDRVQEELGLHTEVGCIPQTYYLEYGINEPDSLWAYFDREVVPSQFPSPQQVLLMSKGGWRYDMVSGRQLLDDVIAVSPFNESIYEWKGVTAEMILQLNTTLNADHDYEWLPKLPNYILSNTEPLDPTQNKTYDLISLVFEVHSIERAMAEIDPNAIIQPAVKRPETSTSIWVNHIRDHSPCHQDAGNGRFPRLPNLPGMKPGHQQQHHKNGTHLGHGYSSADPSKDATRLTFAIVATAVVFLLGSVNVWQRGRAHRRRVYAREQRTLAAMRDYNDTGYRDNHAGGNGEGEDDLSFSDEAGVDYLDDDQVLVDEEEGEFTIC